ncbi:MAG: sugar transferase [Prevotellaceae bacterium]|nr:sugar transferase [Prevotellaceae bacterium]
MYKHFFKRAIDFTIALVALLLIWWLIALIAIFLHFANKGAGAFFYQERPGKNGKIFKVIKFKTMTDERDENGELLSNEARLTKVGRIVRSLSLDELPQFINILKGDMALIGPRPLLTWFLPLYDETQARRHEVRPGITGWAQVNGRNTLSYSKKFEYDVWYVDHLSMMLDIKIVWMTVMNVLKRKDIGNGLQDEVDDLGWNPRRKEAIELFEKNFRNKK